MPLTTRPLRTLALALAMAGAGLAGGCAGTAVMAQEAGTGGPVARVGFEHFGGEKVQRPATGIFGDTEDWIIAHQIAAIRLDPAHDSGGPPVIMLPGYGIAVDSYLETPDGREGWAMDMVRAGHQVWLAELSHTTRSGIDTGFYHPDSGSATKSLFSWGGSSVWRRWGLGPEPGVPFADSRFPADGWDAVVASFTGVGAAVLDGGGQIGFQLEANIRALEALTEKTGPAIILLHSASGVAGFEFARRHPDRVDALVVVEPVGCPADLADVPVLGVFGDHMEVREQIVPRREECRALADALAARGDKGALWSLPDMGIRGNSHLMMMEDNSADIMAMIREWLASVPHKPRPGTGP
ncbi:MAG: hypothetical protein R3E02_01790 [Blastomonas sp.]